jgi:hypothetical protein
MNNRIQKHWKIMIWLFFITAIFFLGLSLPSHAMVTGFLGNFQPDGSFDSLSVSVYDSLQWLVRIKAIILAGFGLFFVFNRGLSTKWIEKAGTAISNLSIRKDLKLIFQKTFSKADRWIIITLGVVTTIGLLIRLIQIERIVGYDEAYTFIYFASRPLKSILTDYSAPNNHVFHSILVHFVYQIFGNHLWALRLPALTAGVLTIPAVYLAGKTLYGKNAAILAAALTAMTPMLMDYSDNARGYTLVCLFSCLVLWIASSLRKQASFTSWALLAVFSSLGFYTLPIMVYPVCAVFLWLLLSWIFKDTFDQKNFLTGFILTSLFTILLTLLLYSPILIFGTGLSSITSNEFVKSQNWMDFIQSVQARIPRVWKEWNYMVPDWVTGFTVAGFLLHISLGWKKSQHKIPIWLAAFVAISTLIIAQRVAPWPRVWLFLLVFYLLWSAAGWSSLIGIALSKIRSSKLQIFFLVIICLTTVTGYTAFLKDPEFSNPEKYLMKDVADFVTENITTEDTLVAVSPVPVRVGYYLMINGIPYEKFYNRDRKGAIQHAIVMVAENSKFPTLQKVIEFQKLNEKLDINKAVLLQSYKQVLIYSVPALQ